MSHSKKGQKFAERKILKYSSHYMPTNLFAERANGCEKGEWRFNISWIDWLEEWASGSNVGFCLFFFDLMLNMSQNHFQLPTPFALLSLQPKIVIDFQFHSRAFLAFSTVVSSWIAMRLNELQGLWIPSTRKYITAAVAVRESFRIFHVSSFYQNTKWKWNFVCKHHFAMKRRSFVADWMHDVVMLEPTATNTHALNSRHQQHVQL